MANRRDSVTIAGINPGRGRTFSAGSRTVGCKAGGGNVPPSGYGPDCSLSSEERSQVDGKAILAFGLGFGNNGLWSGGLPFHPQPRSSSVVLLEVLPKSSWAPRAGRPRVHFRVAASLPEAHTALALCPAVLTLQQQNTANTQACPGRRKRRLHPHTRSDPSGVGPSVALTTDRVLLSPLLHGSSYSGPNGPHRERGKLLLRWIV